MIGETMIPWFNLFSGITVYHITKNGPDNNDGWVNIDHFIKRFENENLKLNGIPYRKEELTDSIITNASILCQLGLLERNRGMDPPRLEYRVTPKGRKFDSLRGKKLGDFRRKFFFFTHALWHKLKKFKKVITIAAFLMAVVNALRFYSLVLSSIPEIYVFLVTFFGFIAVVIGAYFKSN